MNLIGAPHLKPKLKKNRVLYKSKYSQSGSNCVQELKVGWPVLVYVEPNRAFTLTEIDVCVFWNGWRFT